MTATIWVDTVVDILEGEDRHEVNKSKVLVLTMVENHLIIFLSLRKLKSIFGIEGMSNGFVDGSKANKDDLVGIVTCNLS